MGCLTCCWVDGGYLGRIGLVGWGWSMVMGLRMHGLVQACEWPIIMFHLDVIRDWVYSSGRYVTLDWEGNANRSASVSEGSDIEAPTGSVVGLGSNQETATRVFEPIVMEKESERVSGSRPIQRNTRSEMMLKPNLWSETDACMVNKEQYSIPGSNDLSESLSTSVNVLDKSMDKIGDSPPVPQSVVSTGKLMAEKSWSAGSVASSGNATSTGVGVLNDADVFPIQTPLFSSSFKAKMMESIGRASAGKPGFAGVTGFAGSGTPHSSLPHTRVAVVGDSTGTAVGPGIGVTGLEVRAPSCFSDSNSDGLVIAVSTGEASPDSRTGPKMRAPGYVIGFGPGPALDGPIEPVVGSSTLDTNHEAMHAMGLSPEPGERITSETMQVDCHQRIIQLNEVEVVPNLGHGSKQEGDHSRQNPFSDNEVLDRNPWIFINPPPPPAQPRVIDPIAEPRVVDPVCVDPQIARTKGKGIMEDGFIKVTKKKKKNNSPKPRVQIPSLHVSKPGPSKPMGRARPNVITRVTVSNPFEALDDVNQIDDGFPELNATLKKFAMRYVKEKTIPDPDVFKTWCTDLKEYYYSLIKDDGEEVESETDGTSKMIPGDGGVLASQSVVSTDGGSGKAYTQSNGVPNLCQATPYSKGYGGGAIRRQKNRPRRSEGTQNRYTHLLFDLRVAEFLQETTAIEATVLPLSMRGPSPAPPNATKLPRAGSDGRSESTNQPAFGAQVSSGSSPVDTSFNIHLMTQSHPTPMEVSSSAKDAQLGGIVGRVDYSCLFGQISKGNQVANDRKDPGF
ncbi:hypothetical protein L1987_47758 [Smallanthus sonchifolius]|uniref:Uncharacterized protein n=1 Tax=Smallanthus sonchifolius TaxID=185202 RepID=A0ACB9FPM1_9ASTR|nr:hypothetical protein L1987_47758 [Smallanthus sonchifolius]